MSTDPNEIICFWARKSKVYEEEHKYFCGLTGKRCHDIYNWKECEHYKEPKV